MGRHVGHLIGFGRSGGTPAVITGAAAALLSTGTAAAANITPAHAPAAIPTHHNRDSSRYSYKPRTGSGRDPVRLDPARSTVAGRLVPGRPSLHRVTIQQAVD